MKATKDGNISGRTRSANKLVTSCLEEITPKTVRHGTAEKNILKRGF